jgi:hypothetical protein
MRAKKRDIDPSSKPCDIWPHAARSSTGQALHVWRATNARKTMLMSRIIWEICTGETLSSKDVVTMKCGNVMCVFFGHMEIVSRKDIAKKRRQRMTLPDCPASVAKLPVETRVMLTICVANDIGTNTKLARRFGVTSYQVRTIRDYVAKERAANAVAQDTANKEAACKEK